MALITFSRIESESREDTARRLFNDLALTNKFFRDESGTLVFIDDLLGPRRITNGIELFAQLPDLANVVHTVDGDAHRAPRDVPGYFTMDEARCFFASVHITSLPFLRNCVLEPVALPQPDGTFKLSVPGYNPSAEVYYFVQPPSRPLAPSDSTHHLSTAFSGVPFEKPEFRNNILAYLLGAIVLDPSLDAPLLSITGNSRGIGKSSLAQAVGLILTGSMPAPVDSIRGDEFTKQLGTRFAEGSRFIFLDNIVREGGRSFSNDRLAAILTQGHSKKIRQLGYSRSVTQSGVLFCLTMNDGKLDSDLATRSLAVKLYAEYSEPMIPYVRDYVLEHRKDLYCELLGLLVRGGPVTLTPDFPNFRFRKWLSLAQARITPAFGPLAIDEVSSLDDLSQELFSWGFDNSGTDFTAQDFLDKVTFISQGGSARYPSLCNKFTGTLSDKSRLATAGWFLAANVGRTETLTKGRPVILTRVKEPTKSTGAIYRFEEPS